MNETKNKPDLGAPAFSTLVHSIASSALIAMGHVPEMKEKKNKAMAEFNIDLLILLKEKTKGNLNTEEQILIDQCIQDLQISFTQSSFDEGSDNEISKKRS